MNEIKINTYKSIWFEDIKTGNYRRQQKERYLFEFLMNICRPILEKIPKGKNFYYLLAKKPQGVNIYRFYEEIIKSGKREKWISEFENLSSRLKSESINFENKTILDISGEPGYFAADAQRFASRVIVTAFADNVAKAMKEYLKVESAIYDFNTDNLINVLIPTHVRVESLDLIFARSCIGFCIDLKKFFAEVRTLLVNKGYLYISFSPASRAVCARWMFDDYTYLRQYTQKHIEDIASQSRLTLCKIWDDGSYRWDKDLNIVMRLFSRLYQNRRFFKEQDPNEMQQHNIAMLLQKND